MAVDADQNTDLRNMSHDMHFRDCVVLRPQALARFETPLQQFIVGVLGKQVQRRYFTAIHRVGEVVDPRIGNVEGGILDSN